MRSDGFTGLSDNAWEAARLSKDRCLACQKYPCGKNVKNEYGVEQHPTSCLEGVFIQKEPI